MATKKKQETYTVIVPVANDETGKRYAAGDTVTADDFTWPVIENWLNITPPVLVSNDVIVASAAIEEGESD